MSKLQSVADVLTLEDTLEFEKIPVEQRYPWNNTYDIFQQACRDHASDNVMEFLPTGVKDDIAIPVTYEQFLVRLHQTANLFHNLGVESKDAVSIMLPTLPHTVYAIWGAQCAGIASPLNPLLEPRHIAEIIEVTGSKVFVAMAPMPSAPHLWETTKAVLQLSPQIEHLVLISLPGITDAIPDDLNVHVTDYNQQLELQNPNCLDSKREFKGEDIACYMHTGGTTGRPKVAQISQANFAFIAQFYKDRVSDRPRENVFAALPMFHIYGLMVSGIGAIAAGLNIVIMTPSGFRNPNVIENFWHHIERFQFNAFPCVPTILSLIYEVPVGDCDISCLTEVLSGAAPLPIQLKKNFEERFDCTILNGYGMTETTVMLSVTSSKQPPPPGATGLRVPYAERIIAHVDGNKLVRRCESGEAGVVLSRGPNIFAGYLEDSDNEKAWVDGWFNTGDLGYEDEQGYLYLTGRAKDLIIRGGHNIDPVIIEDPLLKHPSVAQAVAVGQPDDYAGELPVVYITLHPGADYNEEDMMAYAADTISERAGVPKRITVLNEIPLTAVGKIFKPELRRMATETVLLERLAELGIQARVECIHDTEKGLTTSIEVAETSRVKELEKALQGFALSISIR
ncbi:acyl-CoA synthetase [Pseudoteredinibacter isoporae]|uniref:acyl-CoA synthetase n=1 Tax=Pseudoteredinibacter isoporae TaxID=570281 RepID=UPI003106466C